MNQNELEKIIHEVVREAIQPIQNLKGELATKASVCDGSTTCQPQLPSKGNSSAISSEQNLTVQTEARKNIARWLGYEPQSESKIKQPDQICYPDRNFIPAPKKTEVVCEILEKTPARVGVWRAGTRYLTKVYLRLREDHAVAKDAVYAELDPSFAQKNSWIWLQTKAKDKEEFLLRPDLGRQLNDESLKIVKEKGKPNCDIQITVADGLSAWAAERYARPMVDEMLRLFAQAHMSVGTVFCVKYSRIAIQDVIGETLGAKCSLILLGERPGLGTGDSLSNYMIYDPQVGAVNAKKSMISNIQPRGLNPVEAARLTVDMVRKMFAQKCSGINLHL